MEIRINITTLHTDTLIALAADVSHQIDAQDWTADDEANTLETILAHLYTGHDMDQVDAMLRLAEANAEVIDILTTGLVMAGRIADDDTAADNETQMNPADFEFSTGYIGQLGVTFFTPTAAELADMIAAAAQMSGKQFADIEADLGAGMTVKWRKSPNFEYDHSWGTIRPVRKPTQKPETVLCDCGHRVERALVMSASTGTSCPDCYDRMSDAY